MISQTTFRLSGSTLAITIFVRLTFIRFVRLALVFTGVNDNVRLFSRRFGALITFVIGDDTDSDRVFAVAIRTVALLRLTLTLLLLLFSLFFQPSLNLKADINDLIIGLASLDLSHIGKFIISERNVNQVTRLCVNVETIHEPQTRQVLIFDAEQITFAQHQFGVTPLEVADKTRVLAKNELFNANIFNDIQPRVRNTLGVIAKMKVLRGEEGVRHFVPYEHVKHVFAHLFPERETEHPLFYIKVGGLIVALLNRNVLVGEKTRKD